MVRCLCRNVGTHLKMQRPGSAERELELTLGVAEVLQLTKCTRLIRQRLVTEAERQFGLGVREIWILLAARCRHPVTQKRIAKQLQLNENVLVLLLDKLETAGCVTRERNPANRREQFVRLTPKGKALTQRVLAARNKFYRKVFAPLDDDAILALFNAAKDVLAHHKSQAKVD